MNAIIAWIGREATLLGSLVQALIMLGVAFGLHITTPEKAAIMSVTGIVLAIIVRQNVTPNATVATKVAIALATPPPKK
jgi:accessory gene regulator protein AgrB